MKAAYVLLVAVAKRAGAQGKRVLGVLLKSGNDPGATRMADRLVEVLPPAVGA